MSKSDQVIHVIEPDGTVREISLYTEPSDVSDTYKTFEYEGQTLYASTTTNPNSESATALKFLDVDGTDRYLCNETPLSITNGTIIVNGNLGADLVVNGNLAVSGNISSSVIATGDVSYGSLTGTITKDETISHCSIEVDGGPLTFDGDLISDNGSIYTSSPITNGEGATTTIYQDLTVSTDSQHPISNNGGTLVIDEGATVTASSTDSTRSTSNYGCGIDLTDGATTIVNGTLIAIAEDGRKGVSNRESTLIVNGKIVCESYMFGLDNYNYAEVIINDGGIVEGTAIAKEDKCCGVNQSGTSTLTVKDGGTMTGVASGTTGYGIQNYNSEMAVESGGLVDGTGGYGGYTTYSVNYVGLLTVDGEMRLAGSVVGIDNKENSTITVNNIINAYSDQTAVSNGGVINGTGKIYANDTLYYSGS